MLANASHVWLAVPCGVLAFFLYLLWPLVSIPAEMRPNLSTDRSLQTITLRYVLSLFVYAFAGVFAAISGSVLAFSDPTGLAVLLVALPLAALCGWWARRNMLALWQAAMDFRAFRALYPLALVRCEKCGRERANVLTCCFYRGTELSYGSRVVDAGVEVVTKYALNPIPIEVRICHRCISRSHVLDKVIAFVVLVAGLVLLAKVGTLTSSEFLSTACGIVGVMLMAAGGIAMFVHEDDAETGDKLAIRLKAKEHVEGYTRLFTRRQRDRLVADV